MTRPTIYDFTETARILDNWNSPKEISDGLKEAALNLSITDSGVYEDMVLAMQRAVISVCQILDSIKEKGGAR